MKLKGLWGASLVLVALAASACGEKQSAPLPEPTPATVRTTRQEANSTRKVLILGSTITGGLQSQEARAVAALSAPAGQPPWEPVVVTPEDWAGMSAEQFMSYRALVIGDAACTEGTEAWQAAIDSRANWGAVVDGNIIIIGSNVASNSWSAQVGELDPVVQGGIELATERPTFTGMYISLGCAYRSAPNGTTVELLAPFGSFKVAGTGCTASGHIPPQYPETFSQYVFDGLLTGPDGCAAKSVFTTYPQNDFAISSLAIDPDGTMPGSQPYFDYYFGETYPGTPFILTRGTTATGLGCGGIEDNQPSGEECDRGDNGNGQPATGTPPEPTCSWTCKSTWCGDGTIQPELGETCDNGAYNGRDFSGNISNGMCTKMCRIVATTDPNRPPVAKCKNATIVADLTCGGFVSVNDGSFDPDNDPITCTQTPGSYSYGNSTATLTCRDSRGKSASCTATVSVVDQTAPVVTMTGSASVSLQCGVGSYTEQGATATDVCDSAPVVTTTITRGGTVVASVSNKPKGVYEVRYTAKDKANNTSAAQLRTVTVNDTLKPNITLNGVANQAVECGPGPYNDMGATAADACETISAGSIQRGGSVDTRTPNTYALTYDVSDSSGNAADRQTRLVTVRDTMAPSLNIQPFVNVPVECGDPNFAHPPVAVTDQCDPGPFTAVPSRTVNTRLLGGQSLHYTATDRYGRTGASLTRTFNVTDNLAPVLTLLGATPMALECGDPFADPGATANDQCMGDRTNFITKNINVDNRNPGTNYGVTYTVADNAGKTATATRPVTVADTLAPTVTMNGAPSVAVECGAPGYADQGATASDKCDGALPAVPSRVVDPRAPGSYQISYSATDRAGRTGTASSSRTVTVEDNLPPTLTLNGANSMGLECGTAYTEQGATASDQCAGNLQVAIAGNVNHQLPATYPVRYSATDGKFPVSATRSVTVRDTLAPTVTMVGSPTAQLECGTGPFADPGATASDSCAGTLPAVPTRVVDQRNPGTYTIGYEATDPSGNKGTAAGTRTVMVVDTQEPTLTLNGAAAQTVQCGTAFNDEGASANDLCRGPLPVTRTGGVNVNTVGNYPLTYNTTDGTFTKSVTRAVAVEDTLQPDITVLGPTNDSFECGSTYTDPGATASDTCDTSVAVTSEQTGDPSRPGAFSITYRATDDSGNTRTLAAARTVTVNDNQPPTLVRNGAATVSLECGSTYNDLGATANDACFGDVTSRIVTSNPVATGTTGTYTVRYNVTDQAGQRAPEVTRSVTVSDTQAPQVSVTGPLNQAVECGNGTYTDPGATALDGCVGSLPAVPSVVVDPRAPGPYNITYSATDPSGNVGTSNVARTVTVQDTLPPRMVLNGPANAGLECGTPFNDPGASANDECRGTLPVQKTGNVDHTAPGSYTLGYSATDGQQTVSATRTVGVSDSLKPTIRVLGPTNDTFECGSTYVDPGATASDICDTSVTVTAEQTGNPSQPGAISISYTATDDSGNTAVAANARTVTVNDNEPPVLALIGPASLGLECGEAYTEQGATANDACFGDVTNRIVLGGASVNTGAPGTYVRTYNVTDQAGRSAPERTRTITVSDTQAPAITVLPPFAQTFECGSGPYTDPGATAADSCAGNVTTRIEVIGSVNGGAAGAYTLSYRVTDPSGNQTTAAQSRTVTVTDTSAPVIALNGAARLGLECGTAYNEQGATANDACAGDLTGNIQTTGPVNSGVAGTYTRTYRVTDPSGQSAQTLRTVDVSDTQAPTLALVGSATQLVECNGQYADPGAQATDLCNGDLTGSIQKSGTVDPAVLGNYTVRYNVKDLSNNAAPELTRAVTVRDSLVPEILVNGPLAQQHECGSTYMDPGATANDQCAGDLTAAIQATRTGNPAAPGSFSITYKVKDPSGNEVTSPVVRRVTVNDETAPTLALLGPGTVNLECGTPYNDQGATANDACHGDLTATIERSGTVNVNRPNQYTLVYNVTDPSGQIATPVSRTVNVSDTQAPSVNVVGPLEQTYQCGTTYEDPGATANDTCAGNLPVVATRTPVAGQPGAVSISYSATDPSGNTGTSSVSRTVRMIDEVAPVVVLNGSATETKECGSPYVDPGASASDTCIAGPLPVTVTGAVDHTTAGTYTLTYRAEDMVGNFDQKTRRVTVNDTQGPSIVLNGSSPTYLECNVDTWADPGAVATDLCSGAEDVVVSGTVNVAQPGPYLITYNARDNSGNAGVPVIRNVLVRDELAPTITLNGPNPLVLECALGNLNNDPMAKVQDACYGDTSHTVFREFTDLNINKVGNYIARYQGDDTVGHVVQATRGLQVVDTTAPVLTVQSPGETVECGTQPSLGVTATDACYGPVAVIATPASLPNEPGQYTVTYSAVDPAGNVADGSGAVTRTITVEDTTEPVLSIADQDVYYECTGYAIGNVWNAPEATATDLCEGSLIVHQYNTGDDDEDGVPGSIDPDDFGPGPTTEVEGLYYVQYLAWDETYNIQGAILSVYVRDTIKPVLGLNPDNDGGDPAYEQVECFLPRDGGEPDPAPYMNPGAWAEDQCYGDLNQEIIPFGEVNKQVPGIYTLSYQVRDGAYNWADELTRTVEVIDSQQPTTVDRMPRMVPTDGTMRTVELSECAEAQDRCEGYLPINLVGGVTNITSNQPGDDAGDIIFTAGASSFQLRAEANPTRGARVYKVEYEVSDSSGNLTQAECTVRVTPPPVVVSPGAGEVVNNSRPTYNGVAQPGTTINIVVDSNVVGTTTATPAGTWSLTQPTALGNGQHTVYVIERDGANNSPSAVITFRVQTTLAGR